MGKITCSGCGKVYWETAKSSWQHQNCKANGETPLDQPFIPVVAKAIGVDREERLPSKRWDKVSYNAYMKDYMRAYRRRLK